MYHTERQCPQPAGRSAVRWPRSARKSSRRPLHLRCCEGQLCLIPRDSRRDSCRQGNRAHVAHAPNPLAKGQVQSPSRRAPRAFFARLETKLYANIAGGSHKRLIQTLVRTVKACYRSVSWLQGRFPPQNTAQTSAQTSVQPGSRGPGATGTAVTVAAMTTAARDPRRPLPKSLSTPPTRPPAT